MTENLKKSKKRIKYVLFKNNAVIGVFSSQRKANAASKEKTQTLIDRYKKKTDNERSLTVEYLKNQVKIKGDKETELTIKKMEEDVLYEKI